MSAVINFTKEARRLQRDGFRAAAPTLSRLLPDWVRDRLADGRRDRGVAKYEENIRCFVRFAGDLPIDQITVDCIKDYKRDLASRVSAGTTRNALTTLRSFFHWAIDEGYVESNPALRVTQPKVEAPDPDPLSREQITTLLTALDTPQQSYKMTHRRNRRAVFLMLYAGLRIAEVAGLEWRDIDLERGELTVRREIAKGGKPRVVPICTELREELRRAARRMPSWAVVDQGDSKGRQGKPLSEKSLGHLFEERGLLARRGLRIHAHQLRKTFATELYVRGEDIATIQRLLGHSDPKTTMRYVGASSVKERQAVEQLRFQAERRGDPA